MENKFIITKDGKHFKSDWLHHATIARDHGYDMKDVVECGMFLDKTMFIIECADNRHLSKHSRRFVGTALNEYNDLRIKSWLKGRELESMLYYGKQAIGLREGD